MKGQTKLYSCWISLTITVVITIVVIVNCDIITLLIEVLMFDQTGRTAEGRRRWRTASVIWTQNQSAESEKIIMQPGMARENEKERGIPSQQMEH